jgi:hypothetical protein
MRFLVWLNWLIVGCVAADVSFEIKLETPVIHDERDFLWYHPRAAVIPGRGAVMTIQKHLGISDYYSGLFMMRRENLNAAWSGPTAVPELDWRPQTNGTIISVADVTPGWHARSRRVIAIGCEVPYGKKGEQLDDKKRQHQTVYAIFNPKAKRWSSWQRLEMPPDSKFDFCRNACAQWLGKPNGNLLVPVYFGPNARERHSVTVLECSFKNEKLVYLRHGDELSLPIQRGLVEPSIIQFGKRYFLTIRNDERGYVTGSDDGLHWGAIRPWQFDDGVDLGSYNTQQHWLAHSDGLFLVYTRSGANNDHIIRHRAPLFMAQVDPKTLRVIRKTERIAIPENGGETGNFGCNMVNRSESWITVSEGIWSEEARRRGAKGATYVARILWSKPNKLAPR